MSRPPASSELAETRGNFSDLERLLEQLGGSPIFELGKPLPDERYLPKDAGRCPACHNRVLLDRLDRLPPCEGGDLAKVFSNQ